MIGQGLRALRPLWAYLEAALRDEIARAKEWAARPLVVGEPSRDWRAQLSEEWRAALAALRWLDPAAAAAIEATPGYAPHPAPWKPPSAEEVAAGFTVREGLAPAMHLRRAGPSVTGGAVPRPSSPGLPGSAEARLRPGETGGPPAASPLVEGDPPVEPGDDVGEEWIRWEDRRA